MIDKAAIFGEKYIEENEVPTKKYQCKDCGVVFFSDRDSRVDECVLCGSIHLKDEQDNETRTLLIVPFEKEVGDAFKDYKSKISWNPLVPRIFKKKRKIQYVQKVFLPTYLVNAKQEGVISFLGGDKQVAVGEKGRDLVLKKYELLYSTHLDYKNVLLNASTLVDNKIFVNICEYDYSRLQEFSLNTLKDSSYVLGDVGAASMGEKERNRLSKYTIFKVRGEVNHTLKKLKDDKTSIVFYDAKEVLVPVYIINASYRGVKYQYFMNGQNGKSYLKLPVGILETVLFTVIVYSIIFALSYFITSYL